MARRIGAMRCGGLDGNGSCKEAQKAQKGSGFVLRTRPGQVRRVLIMAGLDALGLVRRISKTLTERRLSVQGHLVHF